MGNGISRFWRIIKQSYTWKWLFDHIDKDKNGQLDRAEYKAWQTYKKERPDWYKSLRDSLN